MIQVRKIFHIVKYVKLCCAASLKLYYVDEVVWVVLNHNCAKIEGNVHALNVPVFLLDLGRLFTRSIY